jgi:beta-lactamase regulating signal transducer with metallopeptidase domain
MTLLSFLSASAVHDLGWTLLHFLWQGLLLAAMLELILSFMRSATARHNLALAALVLMLLAPVLTFLFLRGGVPQPTSAVLAPSAGAGAPFDLTVTSAAPSPWTGWLVLLWLSGIAGLSLRALGGWIVVETLRRQGTEALPADLMERCRALQQQLQVMRPVRFLQSLRVATPVVVGWLQPVILLPVSALAGLPPQQLDALILHELAHIRRHDAFINALLLAAETVLFYHPALWWVSRRVRIERENCCDDLAVAGCGDAALYVEALASLEAGRLPPGLALAAGGRLKDRAARLLGVPAQTRRHSLGAMMGLAAVTLVAVSVAMAQPGPLSPAETSAIHVPENAIVGTVGFAGNSKLSVRDLGHETPIKRGDVLTRAAVENAVTSLKELYRRNGKYFAHIAPGFVRAGDRTNLVFTITEGPTVGIDRIDFVGNKAFDTDALKAQIATKESAWYRPFPFSTDDNYDPDRVMYDRELLRRFYTSHGYADFKVINAVAQLVPGGRDFDIAFTLDEGKQYRIGRVTINSKIAAPLAQLLLFKSGDIYDASKLQAALAAAPPQVRVHLQRDPGGKPILDIVIDVAQGPESAPVPNKTGSNAPRLKTDFLMITDDKGVEPPIEIDADKSSHDGQGRPTLWQGNVTVRQGNTIIHADSMRAEITPAPSAAPGGTLTRLIADGHVVLTQNGRTVRSTHLQADVIDNALRPSP